jgi:hypothetical protein
MFAEFHGPDLRDEIAPALAISMGRIRATRVKERDQDCSHWHTET